MEIKTKSITIAACAMLCPKPNTLPISILVQSHFHTNLNPFNVTPVQQFSPIPHRIIVLLLHLPLTRVRRPCLPAGLTLVSTLPA